MAPDHAVSASTVYLIRSLGTVYGVAITSTITQNTLKAQLPAALRGIPDKWKVKPFSHSCPSSPSFSFPKHISPLFFP